MGDGGSGCDPGDHAQNPTTLLGKMLRIDVDSGSPYAIPPSNPFAGQRHRRRTRSGRSGLRNPWRFSFDRATGDLYIADVGQNALEEVDFQPAVQRRRRELRLGLLRGQQPGERLERLLDHRDLHAGEPVHLPGPSVRPQRPLLDHRRLRLPRQPVAGDRRPLLLRRLLLERVLQPDHARQRHDLELAVVRRAGAGAQPDHLRRGQQRRGLRRRPGQRHHLPHHRRRAAAALPGLARERLHGDGKSMLKVKRPGDPAKNKLLWKWLNGAGAQPGDFGDPVAGGTSYSLCLYVGTSAAPASTSASRRVRAGRATATRLQVQRRERAGRRRLQGAAESRRRRQVEDAGQGEGRQPRSVARCRSIAAAPLTVQLIRSDDPACWEAVFPVPSIDDRRRDAVQGEDPLSRQLRVSRHAAGLVASDLAAYAYISCARRSGSGRPTSSLERHLQRGGDALQLVGLRFAHRRSRSPTVGPRRCRRVLARTICITPRSKRHSFTEVSRISCILPNRADASEQGACRRPAWGGLGDARRDAIAGLAATARRVRGRRSRAAKALSAAAMNRVARAGSRFWD